MRASSQQFTLENLLKYCLGYIKLINPALSRNRILTEPIGVDLLNPSLIFELDPNTDNKLFLNLKEFYEFTPKELTEETSNAYLNQKELATKLEEIKNKHKVDEYTKQVNLNFGYFKVLIPHHLENNYSKQFKINFYFQQDEKSDFSWFFNSNIT